MECNKEEAIRAKGIAEKKMESKDFVGARKIAIKAQQLYSDLENISQMLMVCDVHCSADRKLFGNETDWYSILQIEQTADEATIKKQYRKFALLLHPDKNNFPGAEAAFKLIGEAQRVLLDRDKRSTLDMKRRSFVGRPTAPYHPSKPASRGSSFGVQNSFRSNTTSHFAGLNPQPQQPQQQPQPGFSNGHRTFWTVCPFCDVKYQYYREVINKLLRCQSCQRSFVAYDMNSGMPAGSKLFHSAVPPQKDVQNQGSSREEVGFKGNITAENSRRESTPKNGSTSGVRLEKVNCKRRKKQVVESDSFDTGSSSSDGEKDVAVEQDGVLPAGKKYECSGEQYVRRSNRHKHNVSYKENLSDDDSLVGPPKRAKRSESSCATREETEGAPNKEASKINKQAGLADDVKNQKEVKEKGNACLKESLPNGTNETKKVSQKGKTEDNDCKKTSEADNDSTSDSSPNTMLDPEVYQYPDPDFNDFDKDRKDECFAVGQTWAIYDTLDAMPRFYARIRKILSPGFKLRITWLEPDPEDETEIEWVNEGLPVSSGTFSNGHSEDTEDRLMFSHLIAWEKGRRRATYKIYPRKGETWAIFKKWDINWKSDPDSNRKYEYEFVEILSEYVEGVGTSVAYLGKVRGFVSLFSRMVKEGMDAFRIPPGELFRFSHRVPSYKMTGEERDDVPKGSFELDPASLSINPDDIAVFADVEMEPGNTQPKDTCLRSPSDQVKKILVEAESSQNVAEDCSAPRASTPEAMEIPDPQFYNFEDDKSQEMFRVGQFWALYSDLDGLPKNYGQIEKIDSSPDFRLHISQLVACSLPKDMIRWHDNDMPVSCGNFSIKKGDSHAYTATGYFSHRLRPELTGKRNECAIFPKKHEVWALYKNWNADITCSNLEKCEYDIVEVLEENSLRIEVLVLERVDDFNSVFKGQVKGGSALTVEINRVELLRFSHQIPAFKLTNERGGSLRGFWELDPAALPVHFFA